MSSTETGASRRYVAVLFKQTAPTEDFSCSQEIVLPGEHTEEEAWQAVQTALQGPRRGELIGGEVRPA